MIWKTDTHEFSATVCQRTGKPCPALAHMARALTQAISTAQPVSTQEFQVEGSSELAHCAEGCTARFRACPDQVRVFCGTDPDVTTDMLDEFADMMFGDSFATLPAGLLTNPPCAMLEASALAHHPKADIRLHATA